MDHWSRRQLVQGVSVAGLGLTIPHQVLLQATKMIQ